MTDDPTAVEPAAPEAAAAEAVPTAPEATPSMPRRRRTGLWITLGTAAAVVLGVTLHQLASAWLSDRATAEWSAIESAERGAHNALVAQREDALTSRSRGLDLSSVLTPEIVPADRIDGLAASVEELRAQSERARSATPSADVESELPDIAPAWGRYATVLRLAASAPDRHDSTARLKAAGDAMLDARRDVESAIDAVFVDAAAAADAQLSALTSATHRTRLEVDRVVAVWELGGVPQGAAEYRALVDVLATLRTSHDEGEARKLDPSQATRLEIEAFARSISFGIPLDFGWAYEVAGLTSDRWIAGTAQFWPGEYWSEDDPGWGHITLSESVEETWRDRDAEALVVHEVGHVQVLREACAAIFESPVFSSDHEVWATAWAIGMGYDTPGAGIEAYGRPSVEQIEASKGCR